MVRHLSTVVVALLLLAEIQAQTTAHSSATDSEDAVSNQWAYSVSAWGYLVPNDQSYGAPTLTADRKWLHLEARYNYENKETGSLWAGYNVERPHSSLGYRTPQEFAAATRAAEAGYALMAPPSSAASPELKNVV